MLAQVLGILVFAGYFITYQQRTRQRILCGHTLTTFLLAVHYLFLGAYSGTALCFLAVVRGLFFSLRGQKKQPQSPVWLAVFLAAACMTGITTWKGPISLLPFAGTILTTLSQWMERPVQMRLFQGCSTPLWLIYDILVGSIGGMLSELFTLVSVSAAIVRYDILKK